MLKHVAAALVATAALAAPAVAPAQTAAQAVQSAWDINMTAIDGEPLPLSKYKGRVLLVVNTASFCGFTPQYKGLQALYDKYKDKGLTVVGVPSGDFMGQEYKSNKEVAEFCESTFGIKFPMAEKANVKGPNAAPFYKWAAATLGPDKTPKWNFHKYLVGRDGKLVTAFGSRVTPSDAALVSAVEAALKG
ncbi:MAG: glutathione peroxidase [Alphaproteobacteria bacterium]|nr:glutathione peroxidase [Alphaproteobacteria bacterium]